MRDSSKTAADIVDVRLVDDFLDAIADDLKLLAVLHESEIDALGFAQLKDLEFPKTLSLNLSGEKAKCAQSLMADVIRALPSEPDEALLDELAVDFADIYLTYRLRAAPTESVWLDKDHLIRQQPMFQVRAAYRLRGLKVADWRKHSEDHLVTQIQFLAHLFGECRDEKALQEAATFLDNHLLKWIDMFAEKVAQRSRTPFYGALARLTASYLDELRQVLSEFVGVPRPKIKEVSKECLDEELEALKVVPVNSPPTGPGW